MRVPRSHQIGGQRLPVGRGFPDNCRARGYIGAPRLTLIHLARGQRHRDQGRTAENHIDPDKQTQSPGERSGESGDDDTG